MQQVPTRASFSEEPGREVLELEDVDGSATARNRASRPSSRGGKGDGVESTHAVFKNVESQVHQLGVSLESVTAHMAALAQLASLSANSGSRSFGGNGSATPRLGASLRDRPDAIDTRAGERLTGCHCACFAFFMAIRWPSPLALSCLTLRLRSRSVRRRRQRVAFNRQSPQSPPGRCNVTGHGQVRNDDVIGHAPFFAPGFP